jgi:histone deacetylase 6
MGPEGDVAEMLRNSANPFMFRIIAREATPEDICTAHSAAHLNWVASISALSPHELRALSQDLDKGGKSLYVGNHTYEAALLAAAGVIETCKNVVVGTVKDAIAVIRPPGHHAESDEAMGFCFLNNIAIAARVCRADVGSWR